MDKDIAALLNLPWTTLLVLACGYAAYYVANIGMRDHHKPIDIAFSTLVFGFFSMFAYHGLMWIVSPPVYIASFAAFVSAVILGAMWAFWGRKMLIWLLRSTNVSHSDSLPNAWKAIFSETNYSIRQLSVQLTDGSWLHCDDLRKFANEPNGPCVLGDAGDLIMFVTHSSAAGDDQFVASEGKVDAYWGTEATYIPKERVARVNLRRVKR